MTSEVTNQIYVNNSNFQHISFSDYHMFSMEKDEITPEYIEALFEKIVSDDERNDFYTAYNVGQKILKLSGVSQNFHLNSPL